MKTKRICPKCKSTDVRRIRGGLIDVLGFSENFVCDECGFSSPIFPDVETDKKDVKDLKIKSKKLSKSVNIVFIVLLVLFILMLIAFII